MTKKKDEMVRDTFSIGEICPMSAVYRLSSSSCGIDQKDCASEDQIEIPLVKGKRFPPCRNCKGDVKWKFVRKA